MIRRKKMSEYSSAGTLTGAEFVLLVQSGALVKMLLSGTDPSNLFVADTAAGLAASNPVLFAGQPARETDTGQGKWGNGTDHYNDLPYSGGGSGVGGLKFLYDDFERNSDSDWPAYADAAADEPVDGTGGSPTVTGARSSSSPLLGGYSMVITKDAADRQGEGIARSTDFTIEDGGLGQVQGIEFYVETSADYETGDMGVFIYDVTNGNLMKPSEINIAASPDGATRWFATFIPSDSNAYRLIFHVRTTNASAYTVKIDNVSVGPFAYPVGAAIGPWTSYKPVIQDSGGTYPTVTYNRQFGTWRRVGNVMQVRIQMAFVAYSGAAGGSVITPIPNGLTVDTSITKASSNVDASLGWGTFYNGASTVPILAKLNLDSTIQWVKQGVSSALILATTDLNSASQLAMVLEIPIAQWSDNINLATDFQEFASNSSSTDADDTTSFVNGRNGARGVLGTTALSATRIKRVQFTRPFQNGDIPEISIHDSQQGLWLPIPTQNAGYGMIEPHHYSTAFSRNVGIGWRPVVGNAYQLDIVFETSPSEQNIPYSNGTFSVYDAWRVRKISGGNSAEVPPVVRARAYISVGGQVLTGAAQILNFDTLNFDTNNNIVPGASWRYTVSMPGYYSVIAAVEYISGYGNQTSLAMFVNGSQADSVATQSGLQTVLSTYVWLDAGEYIDFRAWVGVPNSPAINPDSRFTRVSITRIGS